MGRLILASLFIVALDMPTQFGQLRLEGFLDRVGICCLDLGEGCSSRSCSVIAAAKSLNLREKPIA